MPEPILATHEIACPECGERLWRYDGNIWTCRHGHHSELEGNNRLVLVDSKEPQVVTQTKVPGWVYPLAGTGLAAGIIEVVHLLA